MIMESRWKMIFAPETEATRKELKPILQAAVRSKTNHGGKKYKTSLNVDNLTVDGRRYTVHDIHKLPTELKQVTLSTPTRYGITCFFMKNSPLSNHFKIPQTVRGIKYNSNEQFYMHQKALTFGDQ